MQDINIGAKVQEFRTQKKISLRQLAGKAGMTPSMLSQIENNVVNPSINTLKEIARALEVPMFKFFQDDSLPEKMIVRDGQRKIIGNPGQEVFYQLLTPDTSGAIEFCLMEIPPHSESANQPHEHEGEEVAYVIEGKVKIIVGSREEWLNTGDSIRIPALSPHKWVNEDEISVQVVFAVTPPGF
ncbi:MerR family transcriptional regulator [Lachnoclostridium sp. An14]|uniref:helix-turn-helix domain-containing protein n=1 Tax=Lachnoclostridium sp. An14 TaxID=1965562 RepID=UPI000B390D7F|nr:cupin domain-containing protein [Lachnoclostridium sp. An14]OUQ15744.1 MerR family transcriptional regulator [Lachnoclostridium sp. An14]